MFLFLILSLITVLSALGVVFLRHSIYNVLSLIICFFSIAGHFLILHAPFLAIIQVIVYAGAIMVLFLFTLMLMNLSLKTELKKINFITIFSGFLVVGLLALLCLFLSNTVQISTNTSLLFVGSVRNLGRLLFTEYELLFELSSILFLSSVVGVVMLGKSLQRRVSDV